MATPGQGSSGAPSSSQTIFSPYVPIHTMSLNELEALTWFEGIRKSMAVVIGNGWKQFWEKVFSLPRGTRAFIYMLLGLFAVALVVAVTISLCIVLVTCAKLFGIAYTFLGAAAIVIYFCVYSGIKKTP